MENFDLNALRAASKEATPEPSKEEKIAKLQADIERLEAEASKPTASAEFAALSEAEQQSVVDELNANLPEGERYESVAQYATELQGDGVNIYDIRLTVARAELESLLKG